MRQLREVVAALVIGAVAVGALAIAGIGRGDRGSVYEPGSATPVPDGTQVPADAISGAGLAEPGSLDPVPLELRADYDGENPSPPASPEQPATKLAALTAPLPLDATSAYVVGVTWEGSPNLEVHSRYLIDGTWTPWEQVGAESLGDEDGAGDSEGDGAEVPGTEPIIVATSSAVQLRVYAEDGDVPAGLTVSLYGGPEDSDSTYVELAEGRGAGGAGIVLGPPQPLAAAIGTSGLNLALVDNPQPTIHLRSEWNPRSPSGEFDIGTVEGAVIHHTAGSNSYSKADVPKILRAIQKYHMDSRDWFDIGYNFLVDKYGRIWEGRAGGIYNTIRGVHSHSFNRVATGVSVMGNFQEGTPPSVMVTALVDFLAWKLTLHGVSANGRMINPLSGKSFPAIISHRDVPEANTACPGYKLYRMLPSIRTRVVAKQGLPALPFNSDFTGDGSPDFALLDGGIASIYSSSPSLASPDYPFVAGQQINQSLGGFSAFTAGPSLVGGATPDVLAVQTATGVVFRFPTSLRAKLTAPEALPDLTVSGQLASPGDVTGDGDPDVVAVDLTVGDVTVFAGDGAGGFDDAVVAASWGALQAFGNAGDVDGDGNPDVIAISAAGDLFVGYGDGSGGFAAGDSLGGNWSGYVHLERAGDLNRDSFPDVIAQKSNGTGRSLLGGVGGFDGNYVAWASDAPTWEDIFAVPAWAGGSELAFFGLDASGNYFDWLSEGTLAREFAPAGIEIELPDAASAYVAGDLTGDGLADLLVETTGGDLLVYPSTGDGVGDPFEVADPTDAPEPLPDPEPSPSPTDRPIVDPGWGEYTSVAPAGDINFDGIPDLVVVTADGKVQVFPGVIDGDWAVADPRPSVTGRTGWRFVGVGAWREPSVSDLLGISPTGEIRLVVGGGFTAGTLQDAAGSGWSDTTQLIPIGPIAYGSRGSVVVWDPADGNFEVWTRVGSDDFVFSPSIVLHR